MRARSKDDATSNRVESILTMLGRILSLSFLPSSFPDYPSFQFSSVYFYSSGMSQDLKLLASKSNHILSTDVYLSPWQVYLGDQVQWQVYL